MKPALSAPKVAPSQDDASSFARSSTSPPSTMSVAPAQTIAAHSTREYKLVSSRVAGLKHNVMRVAVPRFEIGRLVPPVRLTRGYLSRKKLEGAGEDGKEERTEDAEAAAAAAAAAGKADLSKIAPTKARAGKRKGKTKTYVLSREDEVNYARERKDRVPWMLSDAGVYSGIHSTASGVSSEEVEPQTPGRILEGIHDGDIGSQYVLLMMAGNNEFQIVPCHKRFRFAEKLLYAPEDEETLSAVTAKGQRGRGPKSNLPRVVHGGTKISTASQIGGASSLKKRLEAGSRSQQNQNAAVGSGIRDIFGSDSDSDGGGAGNVAVADDDAEIDFDFSDMFADDDAGEDPFAVYDDADMAEAARKRAFAEARRANRGYVEIVDGERVDDEESDQLSDDEHDSRTREGPRGRSRRRGRQDIRESIRKVLAKAEDPELYEESDEDANPYISSDDDEEEGEEEKDEEVKQADAQQAKGIDSLSSIGSSVAQRPGVAIVHGVVTTVRGNVSAGMPAKNNQGKHGMPPRGGALATAKSNASLLSSGMKRKNTSTDESLLSATKKPKRSKADTPKTAHAQFLSSSRADKVEGASSVETSGRDRSMSPAGSDKTSRSVSPAVSTAGSTSTTRRPKVTEGREISAADVLELFARAPGHTLKSGDFLDKLKRRGLLLDKSRIAILIKELRLRVDRKTKTLSAPSDVIKEYFA